MEMLVRVAMIEGEAGGAKGRELCRDFGGELAARLPAEEYAGPQSPISERKTPFPSTR